MQIAKGLFENEVLRINSTKAVNMDETDMLKKTMK